MFQNYLKITLRTLLKDRAHSSINLLGLSIGLGFTILIALWIQREMNVNGFHANRDRLFRVLENQTYAGNDIFTTSSTPGPLAPKLKETYPEITHAARISWGDQLLFANGSKSNFETGFYTDPDFMEMLSFPLLEGDARKGLSEPGNVLVSKEMAERFFPGEKALGKTLRLNNEADATVAGIFADVPKSSSLRFDFLLPYIEYEKRNDFLSTWRNNSIRTYFLTQSPITAEAISQKIKTVIKDQDNSQNNVECFAQAMPDWYLRSDWKDGQYTGKGRIEQVRLFAVIALFLLVIACINFMNLATARAANRAKEVGVRKVTGASRGILATQFLGESLLMASLAGLLGTAMATMALPFFNRLFDLELEFASAGALFWLGVAGVVLLTGLASGSYPALFLSAFQPAKVLKGSKASVGQGRGAAGLRKGLVTVQFAISTVLIISTIVIYKQLELVQKADLGYEREHLVYASVNGTLWDKYDAVKTELLQQPGVESVSASTSGIHQWGNNTSDYDWKGKDPEQSILIQTVPVSHDFLKTIGAKLAAGRDFSPEFPNDTAAFIVNETAARLMGLENPVGEQIALHGQWGPVVGLVKDFHVGGLRAAQDPVVLIQRPWKNLFYLRLAANTDLAATLRDVEGVFKKHNPAYPFDYKFCDQQFEEMHAGDLRLGSLAKLLAFLTVFVSCLGLFGLAAFATMQRTKEIGIRKVLGATTSGLVGLLSKDFLKLVVLALMIASPLAWFFMDKWLQDFAYRIDIQWTVFVLAGVVAVVVAFLTVSYQSVKAALADPVKSLRSE